VQAGVGVDALPVPVKPNVVDVLAPSAPFQERFFTVTAEPLVLSVPLQSWLMVWPPASVQVTVQPLIAEAPALTVTSPWKPPDQELTVRYAALQAPAGGGDEGEAEVGGAEVGGVDVGGVDVGGVEVGVLSARVGVCQSLQSAKLPAALPDILIAPGSLPVLSRNFLMFCCKGAVHSGLMAQWLPFWMSDQ
jgi:hypothetical protein